MMPLTVAASFTGSQSIEDELTAFWLGNECILHGMVKIAVHLEAFGTGDI